jgi:hypothetical protein
VVGESRQTFLGELTPDALLATVGQLWAKAKVRFESAKVRFESGSVWWTDTLDRLQLT